MRTRFKLISKKYVARQHKRVRYFRNHPFVVPVATFLVLFFVTAAAFVAVGGTTLEPGDSRIVRVSVDGKQETLPTRAATVGQLLERLDITLNQYDRVEPAADTPILEDNFSVNIYRAKAVTVIDNGKKTTILSTRAEPEDIVKEVGIEVHPEDKVDVIRTDDFLGQTALGEEIVIERSVPVTLNLYGTDTVLRTRAQTVEELLQDKHIAGELSDSSVLPDPSTAITPNMQVYVASPGKQVVSVEEAIPAGTTTEDDISLDSGVTKVKQEGVAGKKLVVYEVVSATDPSSKKLLREVIVVQPVNRVVAKGTRVVITNPSDNVKLGEQLAAARGWTGSEWYCLYQLWQRESGWRTLAGNPSSGAYGIPQSLPGSKMASAGDDWRTNPSTQITWGMGYIARTYGTPCNAWQKFNQRSPHWY